VNCLSYALKKWTHEGGYLLIRRSKLGQEFGITSHWHPISWVPHFLHRDHNHIVTQYTATEWQRAYNQKRGLFRTWVMLWHFHGAVIGDDERESND
jgi:hypothetical protein